MERRLHTNGLLTFHRYEYRRPVNNYLDDGGRDHVPARFYPRAAGALAVSIPNTGAKGNWRDTGLEPATFSLLNTASQAWR